MFNLPRQKKEVGKGWHGQPRLHSIAGKKAWITRRKGLVEEKKHEKIKPTPKKEMDVYTKNEIKRLKKIKYEPVRVKDNPQRVETYKKSMNSINDIHLLNAIDDHYTEEYRQNKISGKDYEELEKAKKDRLREIHEEYERKVLKQEISIPQKKRDKLILSMIERKSKNTKKYKEIPNSTAEFAEKNEVKDDMHINKEHTMIVFKETDRKFNMFKDVSGYRFKEGETEKIIYYYDDNIVELTNKKGEETKIYDEYFAEMLKMSKGEFNIYNKQDAPIVADVSKHNKEFEYIVIAPNVIEELKHPENKIIIK